MILIVVACILAYVGVGLILNGALLWQEYRPAVAASVALTWPLLPVLVLLVAIEKAFRVVRWFLR